MNCPRLCWHPGDITGASWFWVLESNPLPLLLPASPTPPWTLVLATDPSHLLAFFSLAISSFSGLWEICFAHHAVYIRVWRVVLLSIFSGSSPRWCHCAILTSCQTQHFSMGRTNTVCSRILYNLSQSSLPFTSRSWPEAKEKLGWAILGDSVHVSSTHSSSSCFF